MIRLFLSLLLISFSFASPAWIDDSSIDGYICEVGSGKSKLVATINAKANLSRLIEVSIDAEIETKNSQATSRSIQKSKQLISGAKIKNEFFDDKVHFVMICVEK